MTAARTLAIPLLLFGAGLGGRPLLISPEDLDEFVRVAQGTGGALSSAP